ncbi:MAG: hypothetical protein HS104_12645 [Polyangiaceae bacterium]|nr:hypothetical protein [Polyangiaceae bacterium]
MIARPAPVDALPARPPAVDALPIDDGEQRAHELRARILAAPEKAGFPTWPHARVGAPEMRHPLLLAFVARWSEGGAVLTGPTGIGKSTALVALANRLAADAAALADSPAWKQLRAWRMLRRARYLTAAELVRAVKGHRLGAGTADALEHAFGASWLVIDDLGHEAGGSEPLITEIVDRRYRDRRPTHAATGLTLAELAARYGTGTTRKFWEPRGMVVEAW